MSELSIKNNGPVAHLVNEVSGILNRDEDFERLQSELHPTPAVCGTPKLRLNSLISIT